MKRTDLTSKNYRNLFKYQNSPYWYFRKYSSEKGKEFVKSTQETNESRAYKKGLDLYDIWLRQDSLSGKIATIEDFAKLVFKSHEHKRASTIAAYKYQIFSRIVPAFGSLRPDQMTAIRWNLYVSGEMKRGQISRFSKTRQIFLEILRRAQEEGYLRTLPKLKVDDEGSAPPVYIPDSDMRLIIRRASKGVTMNGVSYRSLARRHTKLFALIGWKQGPRPRESLKYRFSMIDWEKQEMTIPGAISKTKRPRTIPLNSKVLRVLRFLHKRTDNDLLFPSPLNPSIPMKDYRNGWETALKNAGVQYIPYNLRDTFITNCLLKGISSTFVGKYCDTSGTEIDRRYAVPTAEIMRRVAG